MAEVLTGDGSMYISAADDHIVTHRFCDQLGNSFTSGDMPDFVVEFYVRFRSAQKVTCSKVGATLTKCSIEPDGTVYFYIPKSSFTSAGQLIMKPSVSLPNANFADGTQEVSAEIFTGKYIRI